MKGVDDWLIGAVAFLGVLFLLDAVTEPAQPDDAAQYCAMWEIWHADRRAGVPVDQRYGWPDQAGRYYKECD